MPKLESKMNNTICVCGHLQAWHSLMSDKWVPAASGCLAMGDDEHPCKCEKFTPATNLPAAVIENSIPAANNLPSVSGAEPRGLTCTCGHDFVDPHCRVCFPIPASQPAPVPAAPQERFCKLFETEKYGQILVKIDRDSECNPEVRIYTKPQDLGVCSVAAGYEDNDEGWDKAEAWFNKIDEAKAVETVANFTAMWAEAKDGE